MLGEPVGELGIVEPGPPLDATGFYRHRGTLDMRELHLAAPGPDIDLALLLDDFGYPDRELPPFALPASGSRAVGRDHAAVLERHRWRLAVPQGYRGKPGAPRYVG